MIIPSAKLAALTIFSDAIVSLTTSKDGNIDICVNITCHFRQIV